MSLPAEPLLSTANIYWKAAYESLDDNLRASITCARTGTNDILAALLRTANQKREICIHKQWKVKLPNGQTIIIRDVVEKITKWVETFIAVGDVAVQFDPTTAALPWAAVRFILRAAISDIQIEGAILADLEVVSRLIARYREFEQIHLQTGSSVKRQMEEGLIRLYADILKFLALVVGHYANNTFVRGVKNVFKTPDNFSIQSIIQHEAELLRIAGLSNTEKLHYLEDSMTRLIDQAARVQKELDEAKHLQLLRWLSSSPFTRHHQALSESRMPKSATWVVNHSEYRRWKNSSSSSILLLHGITGCGKSTMCSAVVDSFLEERTAIPLAAPVAYFYCADYNFEPERAQPAHVMRSILQQLTITANTSQRMVRDNILSEFDRRLAQSKVDGMELLKLTVDDCVKLILELTTSDPATIILDALDTISEYDRPVLINALINLVDASSSVVKVFLTSRNDSQIFSLLQNETAYPWSASKSKGDKVDVKTIEIDRDGNLQDVKMYVELQLSQAVNGRRLLKKDPSPQLWDLLTEKLTSGAGEMFQWVKIQVQYLCHLTREEDIREALQSGRLDRLDNIYTLVLERILAQGSHARKIAIRVFSWLLYMTEAMPPEAFLAVVFAQASHINTTATHQDLATICSSLVLLDSKCNTFRFSHHSVQEFLREQSLFSSDAAQQVIARSCLEICMRGPPVETMSSPDSLDALYRYVALYWAVHCSKAALTSGRDSIEKEVIAFVYDGPGDISLAFMGWLDHMKGLSERLEDDHPLKAIQGSILNRQRSPIFVASAFGLDCLLRDDVLGSTTTDWDQTSEHGHTALYLACASGCLSTADILLTRGSDQNARCGKFGNPLQAACFAGHTSIVELLLEHEASIHQEGTFSNALEACFRGHNEATAMALLRHKHTIKNMKNLDSDGAIAAAAQAGFLPVIELLNKSSLSPQSESERVERMQLKASKAIQGGQFNNLAVLLRGELNAKSVLPDGPIAIAAIYGHEEIIKLLEGLGLDLESECHLGSPLRCAALMGHEQITRTLVKRRADINRCGRHGTALQAASMKGHVRIIRLLLRGGASVNQESGVYGTALQAAAYHGHYDAVEELLNAGAEVEIGGARGISRDAIHGAAEGGHYDIVKLLMKRGFKFYNPPMIQASRSAPDSPDVVLQSYQDVYSSMALTDQSRRNKLAQGSKITKRLPLQGHMAGKNYNCALEASAAKGHLQIIELLLEQNSVLRLSRNDVLASLKSAAAYGHLEVFQLLSNALPSPLPITGFLAALNKAAINGHVSVVMFGVEKVLNSDLSDDHLRQLLILACCTSLDLAERILPIVMERTSTEKLLETIRAGLAEAAKYNRVQIVKLMLESDPKLRTEHTSVASTLLQALGEDIIEELINDTLVVRASNGHADMLIHLTSHLQSTGKEVALAQLLIIAAGNGRLNVVRILLKLQNTWDSYTTDIARALTIASFNGHLPTVEVLLAAGADVNAIVPRVTQDRSQRAPARYGYGRMKFIGPTWNSDKYSSEKGDEQPSVQKTNALQAAIAGSEQVHRWDRPAWERGSMSDCERVIKRLLDHGGDSNSRGGYKKYPIIIAAQHCSEQIVSWLIDAGADVNASASGEDAVLATMKRSSSAAKVLRRLLEAGAHIQSETHSVNDLLDHCLKRFITEYAISDSEALEWLRESMADGPGAVVKIILKALRLTGTGHEGFAGLFQAAAAVDDHACVELLLERGMDVNSAGFYYGTALQAAARFGHVELVQKLLGVGADPNILLGRHHTALRAAVTGGYETIVKILLRNGASINLDFAPRPFFCKPSVPILNLTVESGIASVVSMLVSAGVDVVANPPNHSHPLIIACKSGNLEIIKCLLKSGAPAGVPARVYSGLAEPEASPLHIACHQGREDMICLLLEQKVDIHMEINKAGNPLHVAAQAGHSGAIRLLLAAGADVDRVSSCDHSALSLAAAHGHLDAVRELLTSNATVYDPNTGQNALTSASPQSPMMLELLLEATVNHGNAREAIMAVFDDATTKELNDDNIRLLVEYMGLSIEVFHTACIAGSPSTVRMMLRRGVPVNGESSNGVRALALAARHLQIEIVKLLLEGGADVNHGHPKFGTSLSAAIYGCVESLIPKARLRLQTKRIRDSEPDPSDEAIQFAYCSEYMPTNVAQILKCAEIVQFLIDQGAVVEAEPRDFGQTLHLACFFGDMTIIKTLLAAGANVNSESTLYGTPLFAAIYGGHLEAVEVVLRQGGSGSVNSCHPMLGTPLLFACQEGRFSIAQAILDFGGDPNILGPSGESSLSTMFASRRNCESQEGLLQSFLDKSKGLKLRSSDLVAAARASGDKGPSVKYLLSYDECITVPEEAVIASLDHHCHESEARLQLLLGRIGNFGVTETMLLKAQTLIEVSILLEYRPRCPITVKVVEAERARYDQVEIIKLLLSHEPSIIPTATVVLRILEGCWDTNGTMVGNILNDIWTRNPGLQVTEAMLKVEQISPEAMERLLSYASKDLKISREVLCSVGTRVTGSPKMTRIILEHERSLEITEEMAVGMLAVSGGIRMAVMRLGGCRVTEMMGVLLEHNPKILINEPVFLAALRGQSYLREQDPEGFVGVLQKYGKRFKFTDEMRRVVNETFPSQNDAATRKMFYSLEEEA